MTRPFRRFVPLVVLLLAGCIPVERTTRDAKQLKKEEALTAEVAKRALLQMDRGEIYAGILVPSPKDEPIEVLNADEIAVGDPGVQFEKEDLLGRDALSECSSA